MSTRREFLSTTFLAAVAVPGLFDNPYGVGMSARDEQAVGRGRDDQYRFPFNPEGPFDVRLRPKAGHVDYWRQTVFMQSFDRFGEPKFIRHIDGYARKEEFVKEGSPELWHRVTWRWSTEEDRDASGKVLRAELFSFSKNFSHEAPVNQPGGTHTVSKKESDSLPDTPQAFSFLQQPGDVHYMFSLVSDQWTGIEKLKRLGDTVNAVEHPTAYPSDESFPPKHGLGSTSGVDYWRGAHRLKLILGGLTTIDGEWCALIEFDSDVPERLTIPMGDHTEYRRLHAYTMGTIAISLENNHVARCAWNHIIVDGSVEPPPELGFTDAAPGVRFWRRQVLLKRVSKQEFESAAPSINSQ
jgi:hypothetical protein